MARRNAKEHVLQRACVKLLRTNWPHLVKMTMRHDGGDQLPGGVAAYRLRKLEGTQADATDLVVIMPGALSNILCVEFKIPGKDLTAGQRVIANDLL